MPTPDGREWLRPIDIVKLQIEAVESVHPNVPRGDLESLSAALAQGIRNAGLGMEFKVLRLTERLKDALEAGHYGPLTVPNTVDREGNPIPTPLGLVNADFRRIYSVSFLDEHDEEGNRTEGGGE